jgi:hypothetical protein
MAKRLTREQKGEQALIDIINQMFIIAGHKVTYDDIKDRKDNWFVEWTMTESQTNEWWYWGVTYLRKSLKMNKLQANHEMLWFNLQWGLTYSNWEEYNKDEK